MTRPSRLSRAAAAMATPLLLAVLCVCSARPATADGCPRTFDQYTTGLPSACVFVGTYNARCGGQAVALFAGDGEALVVGLSTAATRAPLFLPARVESATQGTLVAWQADLDLGTARDTGSVQLEAGGERLRLRLAGTLMAGDCEVEEFVGRFAGMAPAGAPAVAAPAPRGMWHVALR